MNAAEIYTQSVAKANYTNAGAWWNDNSIPLVRLADGNTYALNGWNGEEYTDCWLCTGECNDDASRDAYTLRPIYGPAPDEDDGSPIIDFDVYHN